MIAPLLQKRAMQRPQKPIFCRRLMRLHPFALHQNNKNRTAFLNSASLRKILNSKKYEFRTAV
jgi:hypothetical protein